MREILFRGKSVNDGEWCYGSLVITTLEPVDDTPIKHYHIEDMTIGCFPNEFQSGISETVAPETVGQFTGLTDKNGTKIFEGDICKVGNLLYKVEFKYSCWWFTILSNNVYCCPAFNSHCGEYCEIIGNIHDNPELLEVE